MTGGGTGFLVPGGASQEGVICVFDGELVGIVVDAHHGYRRGTRGRQVVRRGARGGVAGSAVVWVLVGRPARLRAHRVEAAVDVDELPVMPADESESRNAIAPATGRPSVVSQPSGARSAQLPAIVSNPGIPCRPSSSSARRTRCSPGCRFQAEMRAGSG